MNVFIDGIGADTGSALALRSPLLGSGGVFYVSSVSGSDSSAGENRSRPFATLAAAVAAAAAGDVVVLLEDHEEAIATAVAINKPLTIVGEGRVDGQPTAKLTTAVAATAGLNITAANVRLNNIRFGEPTAALAYPYVLVAASNVTIEDCYFEENSDTDVATVIQGSAVTHLALRRVTFINVETGGDQDSGRCRPGLQAEGDYLTLEDVTCDGGLWGFRTTSDSSSKAIDLDDSALVGLRIEGLSLLRGADVSISADTTGFIWGYEATGGGKVDWSA